jgi:multimeric flavodoxin WrbA
MTPRLVCLSVVVCVACALTSISWMVGCCGNFEICGLVFSLLGAVVVRACGFVGSPKRNGNVDLLVSEVLNGLSSRGVEVVKVFLNDLSVRPCQSCGVDPRPKFCVFDDGMKMVYDALESSDVVVLGSPVYFDSVSAQTKLVIDRCNCLMPYVKQCDGSFGFVRRLEKRKKGVFVGVAGPDQAFDAMLTTVKGFFNWANVELCETILYVNDSDELGGVRKDRDQLSRAFMIGRQIAEQEHV